jgi:Tfp pilus assembly protein PilV
VEVLVALAMFSLSAPAIAVGVSLSVRTSHISENLTVATILAQDKLEELRAHSGFRSAGGDTPRPGFSREWSVATDSPETGMTRIDVSISWSDYDSHALALATVVNE